ncbi:hypothetical protein GCM10009001_21070 [Virgibacillus siamensis]|uniref:Transposase n=1 Tax=Virgibacillus siamensis TaxID=480071 RepID=A0ABN1G4R8_9BACI
MKKPNSQNGSINQPDILLPADVDSILDDYGHLLKSYSNLSNKASVFGDFKRTIKRLEVLFPFVIHGITGLHAVEN